MGCNMVIFYHSFFIHWLKHFCKRNLSINNSVVCTEEVRINDSLPLFINFLWLQNHYSDCSHEIKRLLLLSRKAMTNLNSILKSKDITFPTKVCIVKVIVFPVVMYRCESRIIKKVERQRIDAFEMCWRRLFRVPWTARRSNQSILRKSTLNIHWKDHCWSILRPPDAKRQLIGKDLDAGEDWRQKKKGAAEVVR